MRLYYAEVLNPRKVCALAKHIGAPVTYVHVDLTAGSHRTPAFRALNPNAKVPVLEDGARVLWESDAIMCHLARHVGSDVWPLDDRQVDVIRWLSWNQVHFQRAGGALYFENVIKPLFRMGLPDPVKVVAATESFQTHARVLDAHLADREWLVGDTLTVADFSVSATLPYARDAQLPLEEFPAIRRWRDRLNALEAWRHPYPTTLTSAA
jgi:glutathione S-transferase